MKPTLPFWQKIMATKSNIILEKSFDFSIKIIHLFKLLNAEKEFIISKQLLRSATSIWANLTESNAGQSRKDFLHKVSISHKEANETLYRLRLLEKSKLVDLDYSEYIKDIREILAILTKIILTTKENMD